MLKKEKYKVAIYIRLSKEDEKDGQIVDSESVKNQRQFLLNYIKNNGYQLYKEYVDDGYSGSNFDRPSFKKMIDDIENKIINMVVVKDLSRLGRNNIETNEYIERYFPKNNVRFIAVLDDVDTEIDTYGNEMAPFKVFMNAYYNRETSKKIKTTLKNKKQSGLFTGWKAPYGYKKDPNNSYQLLVDNDTAFIVKTIFKLAKQGYSSYKIATYLTEKNIKTPFNYAFENSNKRNLWCPRTINEILSNETYIGNLTQGRRKKIYGLKKEVRTSKEDWIIVKNTHEAIIDSETFYYVQKLKKKIQKNHSNHFLLSKLLYCKECGHSIGVYSPKNSKQAYTYCNYYRRYSKYKLCTPHTINYFKLEKQVLNELKNLIYNHVDINKMVSTLKKYDNKNNEISKIKEEIITIQKKQTILEEKLDSLYFDFKNCLLDKKQYLRLKNNVEKEQKETSSYLNNLIKKVSNLSKLKLTDDYYLKSVNDYLCLEKNNSLSLTNLIDKIEIDKNKQIDIYFNFNI